MDQMTLALEPRTVTGKKVKRLRAEGLVPASICGRGVTPENYVLDAKTFTRIYQIAGRTTLIELQTPTGARQAFVRQVQRHPISQQWLHVDFRVVDLRVAMTADVPLVLTGHNELVDRGQAIANLIQATLHVRGLPAELPHDIPVDISALEDFGQVLHVSDLQIPANIEVLTPETEAVVSLTASTTAVDEAEISAEEQAGEPALAGEDADDNE